MKREELLVQMDRCISALVVHSILLPSRPLKYKEMIKESLEENLETAASIRYVIETTQAMSKEDIENYCGVIAYKFHVADMLFRKLTLYTEDKYADALIDSLEQIESGLIRCPENENMSRKKILSEIREQIGKIKAEAKRGVCNLPEEFKKIIGIYQVTTMMYPKWLKLV